jgi:hypothetical protein
MVARFPQRVAIQSERSALRYSELNSAATCSWPGWAKQTNPSHCCWRMTSAPTRR